ncbi:MAG: hypothetical protein R3B51_08785 [Thermodesulfobacteriota bacterium]
MRNARATFSANFFACAGFRVVEGDPHEAAESAAKDALKSGARIIVICSSDAEYPNVAPEICKLVKNKKPDACVVVAGNPRERIEGAQERRRG